MDGDNNVIAVAILRQTFGEGIITLADKGFFIQNRKISHDHL